MKTVSALCFLFLILSCADAKESYYTGSTPANRVVREFLGIPPGDSVDFIRWSLAITDVNYKLTCNYGIGKPNTDGFIGGGRTIEFGGTCTRTDNIYSLQREGRSLRIIDLNSDLVHLLDNHDNLLVGNGGWSYTLNTVELNQNSQTPRAFFQQAIRDSIILVGRTPCAVPALPQRGTCYKLKWKFTLYKDGRYTVQGTSWDHQPVSGKWITQANYAGQMIYRLDDGNTTMYLFRVDENIFYFTDSHGKLLVGDRNFSYTLSRVN
jgi:hypothetical protein